MNPDTWVEFNGNIRKTHPKVFINSLKNKIKFINNSEHIKDAICQNLKETAQM